MTTRRPSRWTVARTRSSAVAPGLLAPGLLALGLLALSLLALGCSSASESSPVPGDSDADSAAATQEAGAASIERLWSPSEGVARIEGSAPEGTSITVDDEPADVTTTGGNVTVDIGDLEPRPYTVCLGDACSRVMVKGPPRDEAAIRAAAEAGVAQANAVWDLNCAYPEWTIEVDGLKPGAGGSTNATTRTVRLYLHEGRTVEEFATTMLHEYGHVVAAEQMDDDDWAAYGDIRSTQPAPAVPAGEDERWSELTEDFAEVFVHLVTDGAHQIRSTSFFGALDEGGAAAVASMLDLEVGSC